ncbi:hypothetical protein [Lacrimispora xylanisolvens]|uniref:hypothetical protein n=1 Tax=Lacrimispora xylanisolvens TaxID=384636 RepID=UPI00240290DB
MDNKEKRLMLPKLISHGCVLQTGERTRIWGLAAPGEGVSLRLLHQEISCRADGDGNWEAYFHHLQPGGPFIMELTGESGETIQVSDVYLGGGIHLQRPVQYGTAHEPGKGPVSHRV